MIPDKTDTFLTGSKSRTSGEIEIEKGDSSTRLFPVEMSRARKSSLSIIPVRFYSSQREG